MREEQDDSRDLAHMLRRLKEPGRFVSLDDPGLKMIPTGVELTNFLIRAKGVYDYSPNADDFVRLCRATEGSVADVVRIVRDDYLRRLAEQEVDSLYRHI